MLRQTLALLFAGLALGGCAAAPQRVVYVEAHSYPPPPPEPRVVHVEHHHHHGAQHGPRYAAPRRAVPPPRARGPRAHGAPRRPHASPPRIGTRPLPPDQAHHRRHDRRQPIAKKPKRTREHRAHDHKHKAPYVDRERDSAKR